MIMKKFRLDGQTALVTGGTRGIGLGIVEALAEAGAHVVLSSKTPKPDVIERLRGSGHKVDYLQNDIREVEGPDRLIAEALELVGKLDVLVNNAGIARHGETESFSDENYRQIMDINLDSVFRACRAGLIQMRKQQSGVILNIGSISGYISNIPQHQVAYNASKAAVHMLTKSLASEYANENIRVNAIAPGYIQTDMTAGGYENPEWAPIWKSMTPMPKVGTPEDIGAAAIYLCSPASAYVTGEVLVIDGGYLTR